MKKFLFVSVCFLIAVSAVMVSAQDKSGKSWVLKYNQLEPPEHPQGVTQSKFAEKIEELSGGQIKVKVYASGSLFTQQGEVTAMMDGSLELSTLSFQDMSPYLPEAAMFAAPYFFTSYDHAKKVFAPDSEVAADFSKRVSEKCGYIILAPLYQGMRCINTKWTKPIVTPEDMKGMILRMPNAPAWIDAGCSLGAKVTPIAYSEVYTALQTGTVDAQDNPLPGTYAMKFYEVTKQISLTRHIIDIKLLCVTNKVWNAMTPLQQQWMREAAYYACEQGGNVALKQEAEILEFMKNYGMIITEPDINAFQQYSFKYYQDHGLTKDWDMDLYRKAQALK